MSEYLAELRELLQDHLTTQEDCTELGVLRGYVVLAEWSDSDGLQWITSTAGDINDDAPAIWTVKGWLYHALEMDTRHHDEDDDGDET